MVKYKIMRDRPLNHFLFFINLAQILNNPCSNKKETFTVPLRAIYLANMPNLHKNPVK